MMYMYDVSNHGSIEGLYVCALQPRDSSNTLIENDIKRNLVIAGFLNESQVANNRELTKMIDILKILENNVLVPTTFTSSLCFLI